MESLYKKKNAYTLLELVLVAAILGVLASFGINTFKGSQARSRDTQRKSDLNQYRVALETYGTNHNGLFPGRNGLFGLWASDKTSCGAGSCYYLCTTDLGLSGCPADPYDGQNKCYGGTTCRYWYQGNNCDNGSACATNFTLRAMLENENAFWVVCANGKSGNVDSATDFSTLGGSCPL
ncbi:hypothetical protein A2Z22_00215 [Candidatus Woesebacteria bacterium RBG_16_34_12]|uniref:Type II secretion system protein GspG C-terminal domain-containing protein n=1 Tax=Candidatus Woesebacteria bacterium RBG_16_34_12 TaxID=1802480 RepID=A0A1F7X8T2_9BACT|nr:MAG: hypothetical protein A2Z22_00215 [Candidatus Woesebacteria bacterium RBG_16_34_12]